MPDDTMLSRDVEANVSLARIADALGLPRSYFATVGGNEVEVRERNEVGSQALLALVRLHLQTAQPEARRDFVEAVNAIVDELPA